MSKILRKTQKIFGSSSGANQIEQFGSLAAGTPVYTLDPAVIQALSNYLVGWFDGVVGDNLPAIEDLNALCFLFAYQLSYIFQAGVSEWDSGTTYYIGSIVNDGTGLLYTSITDNNLNHVVTDPANWKIASTPITTLGDIIFGTTGGVPTRLAGNSTTTQKVLTQTGTGAASAAPVWKDIRQTQTILSAGSGTYTPPAGVTRLKIRMVGGGGGGGACNTTLAGQCSAGGGGGGGGYLEKIVTSLLTSYAYSVGAAGAAGVVSDGGDGGDTSFGTAFLKAPGGKGGFFGNAGGVGTTGSGGVGAGQLGGGVFVGGDITINGSYGTTGVTTIAGGVSMIPFGGASQLSPAQAGFGVQTEAGSVWPPNGPGGGGTGGKTIGGVSTAAQNGGAGFAGIIIIDEFYI